MINVNCLEKNCVISGQSNLHNCYCVLGIKNLNPEKIIQLIEDNKIVVDTIEDAKDVVKMIEHLSYNNRIFKIINNFLNKVNKQVKNSCEV